MTGRLEVCNANEWGTVCHDQFYLVDARVACRQLGFSDAGKRGSVILCEFVPVRGNQCYS